jgi:hypothetical protein
VNKALGLITIVAGLPGLGALLLIGMFGDFPLPAKMVVINSFVLRGVCGTLGGILLWRGSRWGYYLSLITWLYLVTVSVLTLSDLFDKGLILSLSFLQENYPNFGKPFARSIIKIILGIPIIYFIFKALSEKREIKEPIN